VRNLAGEIAQEFQKRQDDGMPTDSLKELVEQIVSFHMKVNSESSPWVSFVFLISSQMSCYTLCNALNITTSVPYYLSL
jgi:hypothetical protein